MIKLVVALGNPGIEYEMTRHNIAWLLLDCFDALENKPWKEKFKGLYTELSVLGEKRYFLKPMTYMNLSGESVLPLCQFYKIKAEEVLVVQDEIDLSFGQIMFKKGGGLAGHNGLKSIAQHLGSSDFLRLRMGIGRPIHGSVSSWVLGKFPTEQDIELNKVIKEKYEALSLALEKCFEKAASKYSKKNFIQE